MTTEIVDGAEFFAAERLKWSEHKLQSEVVKRAVELGWDFQYHTFFSDRSETGFPDLVLAHSQQRRLVIAEMKSMKGKLRPGRLSKRGNWLHGQEEWLDLFRTVAAEAEREGADRRRIIVCHWKPCCWNSGEIEEVLR